MANKVFYFGTSDRMAWVPAPNFGMGSNNVSWRASGTLLNGGAFARSSTSSHMEYSMAWPLMSREDSYSLIDYFNGIYGDGPFYFIDPVAAEYNILPNWMATPSIQAVDGPSMVPGQTPTLQSGYDPVTNFPTNGAQYIMAASQVGRSFKFPVPPGYTFRFGWFGSRVNSLAGVRVVGATTALPAPIDTLGGTPRFNLSMAPDANGFVTLTLVGGPGGDMTLIAMHGAVLPAAQASPTGNFVSGRGNSGVRLTNDPTVTSYSAVLNNANVGVSANFIETGAWE